MTASEALKKTNETEIFSNLQDKRQKQKPNYILGHLVWTCDIRKVFRKVDSTIYSYGIYTITEIIHDTFPGYRIGYLPER